MNQKNSGMIISKFTIAAFGLTSIVAISALADSLTPNQVRSNVADKKYVHAIAAGRLHEECFPMEAGEQVTFSFQSNEIVNFNIHYHKKHKVLYSIKIDKITKREKTVQVTEKTVYCLTWKNNQKRTATVSYNFIVNRG